MVWYTVARWVEETNMLPFLAGLLLGIGVGVIPINLASGVQVKLGTAGGAFLVSLIVGHFGGLGPLRLYVPMAAKNLSRELGLMLFLLERASALARISSRSWGNKASACWLGVLSLPSARCWQAC